VAELKQVKGKAASVVFVQGFGRGDPFTGVPPESLWGWRRNVGILVAILNLKGISWEERYARRLSEVRKGAGLFILRDWRYSQEEVSEFRCRHRTVPVISMLFQGPRACVDGQKIGEERALFGITHPEPLARRNDFEDGLFMANRVIVRSRLNADAFARLGYPREKMVLLPHAPVWTLHHNRISPAELPRPRGKRTQQQPDGLNLLFIGDNPVRKGLFRLHDAFSSLRFSNRRLHIYSHTVHRYIRGEDVGLPDCMLARIRRMMSDPAVRIHPPYRDVTQLVAAHAGADLMVCPSLFDCGPNVLVEAYQLGTPVLSSTLCGAVSDLPRGSIHLAPAPRWWQRDEEAPAFTQRLAEGIAGLHLDSEQRAKVPSTRPDVSPLIETIVNTWEGLLNRYL
jgi:glycosyltransferase involved in cell wall biosynthesis